MKPQKQQAYLPIEVKKELPKGEVCAINGKGDMLVGYIKEDNDSECESYYEVLPLPEYWLKKEDRFVFSEEELRGFVDKIVEIQEDRDDWVKSRGQGWENEQPTVKEYINNLLKQD